MSALIKNLFRSESNRILAVLSLFALSLSLVRVMATGKSMYLFMVWNLFLAWVPWLIASLVEARRIRNRVALTGIVLAWLLFFPNAPYVLTDLMHMGSEASAPLWYDLILLLSYGFAGLLFGFVSLRKIETLLATEMGTRSAWVLSVLLMYLACFGIYIGRFLRWNSWDMLTNPHGLLLDVFYRLANLSEHPTSWVFTLLFGSLLNILYWSHKSLVAPSLGLTS